MCYWEEQDPGLSGFWGKYDLFGKSAGGCMRRCKREEQTSQVLWILVVVVQAVDCLLRAGVDEDLVIHVRKMICQAPFNQVGEVAKQVRTSRTR